MTPMRPLKDFLPLVLPFAPTAPAFYAEQCLRQSAIRVCETSRLWRHKETVNLTTNGQILDVLTYASIHEIESVYFGSGQSCELTPVQYSDIAHLLEPVSTPSQSGVSPSQFTQITPETITVFPFLEGELHLSLIMKPRSGTQYRSIPSDPLHDHFNQVPDFMFTHHAECLAAGAIYRLLRTPGQSFSDMATASVHGSEFNQMVRSIHNKGQTGQQRAPLRSKPYFM